MKLPQLLSRKKLRATTARRALAGAEMDYEEMSEPNMKLSRALLVVLVLHVVAVAGIVAFNTIRARQGPFPAASSEETQVKNIPAAVAKPEETTSVASLRNEEVKTPKSPPKPVTKDDPKVERARPVEENPPKATATKTHVVAKGDTLSSIARKFKVPYDDIMAANHIDDPRKLQIGQKLVIPQRKTTKSTTVTKTTKTK